MQAFPTHRINTGKTCRNSFQRKLYFQKKQFATQNGKYPQKTSGVQEMVLRNIAPREGTETTTSIFHVCGVLAILRNIAPREGTETFCHSATCHVIGLPIKKYSSPRGDGNISSFHVLHLLYKLRNIAPREGTETPVNTSYRRSTLIKKYSSPRGDGNIKPVRVKVIPCTALRNIAPREGTEIHIFTTNHSYLFIKKYSSPRGDGNKYGIAIIILIIH